DVNVMQVHSSSQAILCLIETVSSLFMLLMLQKIEEICGRLYRSKLLEDSLYLFEKVNQWREKLKDIQKEVYKDPSNDALKKKEAIILKECNIAKQGEETLLYQHTKIEWLSDGDKNTKFFHVVVKGRAHRYKIEFLRKEVPVKEMEPNTIHITNKVFMEDATMMTRPMNDEEVKKALFEICDNKAPGLMVSLPNSIIRHGILWEKMCVKMLTNFSP
ncbi:hypothetical protein Tco_0366651, partial [Tanacetum coccineum]